MSDDTNVTTKDKKGAPSWATGPFKEFIDHGERLGHLLHLSMRGISVLRGMPRIVVVIAKVESDDSEDTARRLDSARKEADLAQREVNEGFPLLTAQTVIALWCALEAAIRLFLARWLQHNKDALEVDAVQKLRVRIGEYEQLKDDDRYFYILDRLEQETSAPLKCGVTRFELLLEPFGLAGAVDEKDRRDLFELNQVRNCLVHRSGIADRRLVESCPWLNLTTGATLKVDSAMTNCYFDAAMSYTVALIVRLGERYGVDMSDVKNHSRAQKDNASSAG